MIDPHTLDPDIRSWSDRDAELQRRLPSPPDGDFGALRLRDRQISDALASEFALAVNSRIEITDCEIAGVPVRRYRPLGTQDSLPTQVFLHGGGFISGSPWELVNDSTNALRAAQCGLQILSVDYRLAPEHPFPAAVHDLLAVLDALWEDPHRWAAAPGWLGLG